MTQNRPKLRLPGLDGLRAVAVLMVISLHLWFVRSLPNTWLWAQIARHGGDGVTIFFVLSGFLITWLLLQEETETGRIGLRGFYLRRVLRIIPPAITYLLCMRILAEVGVVQDVTWTDVAKAALFVRNFYVGLPAETIHYWSLAVEEQFYLVWPLLLILLPRRVRAAATVVMIVAAPAWRFYLLADGPLEIRQSLRTDVVYDSLLYGCLLALLRQGPRSGLALRGRFFGSPFILLFTAAGFAGSQTEFEATQRLGGALCPSFFCAGVAIGINYLLFGNRGFVDRLLNWRPVVWIGRISYSLYLWQQFFCYPAPGGVFEVWMREFPQNVLFSFACAALSFYLIERPFTRLRARL